jgi:hypothetical protein
MPTTLAIIYVLAVVGLALAVYLALCGVLVWFFFRRGRTDREHEEHIERRTG